MTILFNQHMNDFYHCASCTMGQIACLSRIAHFHRS